MVVPSVVWNNKIALKHRSDAKNSFTDLFQLLTKQSHSESNEIYCMLDYLLFTLWVLSTYFLLPAGM